MQVEVEPPWNIFAQAVRGTVLEEGLASLKPSTHTQNIVLHAN